MEDSSEVVGRRSHLSTVRGYLGCGVTQGRTLGASLRIAYGGGFRHTPSAFKEGCNSPPTPRTKVTKVGPPRARVKSAKVRPTPYVYYPPVVVTRNQLTLETGRDG